MFALAYERFATIRRSGGSDVPRPETARIAQSPRKPSPLTRCRGNLGTPDQKPSRRPPSH